MKTTIVLADDHAVVRVGVRTLLESQGRFAVVGEASDGLRVVSLVERLDPDLLIVDLMLPNLNGLEVTWQARKRSPRTKVLVLSMYTSESYVAEALRNGAMAYILKQSDDLLQAVDAVLNGRRYLSPPLSEWDIDAFTQKVQRSMAQDRLTPREREVLVLAAQGYTNQAIAERMMISRRTVETHRANMMHKLDLVDTPALLRYALQHHLIPMIS